MHEYFAQSDIYFTVDMLYSSSILNVKDMPCIQHCRTKCKILCIDNTLRHMCIVHD